MSEINTIADVYFKEATAFFSGIGVKFNEKQVRSGVRTMNIVFIRAILAYYFKRKGLSLPEIKNILNLDSHASVINLLKNYTKRKSRRKVLLDKYNEVIAYINQAKDIHIEGAVFKKRLIFPSIDILKDEYIRIVRTGASPTFYDGADFVVEFTKKQKEDAKVQG